MLKNLLFPDNHLNMNRENFAEFLKNPEKLFQVTYEELKTLSMQYPFSANLHLLLWQKSRQEGHSEEEKNLSRAAAYTFDRPHLFHLFHSGEALTREDFITEMEEFLELKELALLDSEPLIAKTEHPAPFRESDLAESPAANLTVGRDMEEDEDSILPDPGQVERPETTTPERMVVHTDIPDAALSPEPQITEEFREPEIGLSPVSKELIVETAEIAADGLWAVERWRIEHAPVEEPLTGRMEVVVQEPAGKREIIFEIANDETPPETEIPPAPLSKSEFLSWRRQNRAKPAFVIPEAPLPEPVAAPEPRPTLPPEQPAEDRVRRLAEQSLTENEGLISETLANLLANQGQNDKAIKMFERLMVKNPEKSAFFAAKIEELKKY